jgi:Gas vesicle synthesis protein GvpL/GvpF
MREEGGAFESLREAIEVFAAEHAPELVAEARAEAAAKVRSILTEAMAESLLDHVGEHLGARSPARRPRPQPRRETPADRGRDPAAEPVPAESEHEATAAPPVSAELAYYVYGVTWAGEAEMPEQVPGVDPRHPAELVEQHGLAAITSRVSLAEFGEEALHDNLNDVGWLEEKARAHEEVLDDALSRMTVVPMRLCTIYRSADQVEGVLASEHDAFADALRRLEGKAEWGVKLIAEPGAVERAAAPRGTDASVEGRGESAGAAYMNRKRREAELRERADAVAEGWADVVHTRLAACASEALLNPLQNPEVSGHTGEMLLNGVYLVDNRDADAFSEAVDALSGEFRSRGAAVELTGPWPPYNFVKSSIEAAR